jgi:hypothetical protein
VDQGFIKKWWAVPQTMHEEMKLIITLHINITITVTTTTTTITTFGLLPAGSTCLSVAYKTLL